MRRYDCEDGDPCDTGASAGTYGYRYRYGRGGGSGSGRSGGGNGWGSGWGYGSGFGYGAGYSRSPLLTVAGTIDRSQGGDPALRGEEALRGDSGLRGEAALGSESGLPGDSRLRSESAVGGESALCSESALRGEAVLGGDPDPGGAAGALRSWVVGWTHRFEPPGSRRSGEPNPAGVRRLVEAVVDVLLERRPAEQVKRWVSREVFGLLSTVAQRRAATRFAARSMVRSIRLHAPGPDAVESTVLVQDGPRVRAVALRFERTAAPLNAGTVNAGLFVAQVPESGGADQKEQADRLEWRCTALQFA